MKTETATIALALFMSTNPSKADTLTDWAVGAAAQTYSITNATYTTRIGALYAGEMYSDHDSMEDLLELKWPEIGASPTMYDPHVDGNMDGWSNFAEIRARCHAMYAGDEWTGHPQPEVTMDVVYNGARDLSGRTLRVEAYRSTDLNGHPAVFTVPLGKFFRRKSLTFRVPDSGRLCEGSSVFVVSVDSLLGVATDVDVGWRCCKFKVELAAVSPIIDRIDVTSDRGSREAVLGSESVYREDTLGRNSSVNGAPTESNSNIKHIRIVPYKVKGTVESNPNYADENGYVMLDFLDPTNKRVVAEFDLDLAVRPSISEFDILREGVYDLDWSAFEQRIASHSAVNMGVGDVKSVLYRVVVGDGEIGRITTADTNTVVNALGTLIERRFEETEKRTVPTPLSPGAGGGAVVYSAQPTFRWTMEGEDKWASRFGSTYTAFRLQVLKGVEVAYDSGVRRAPAPDADGVYSWSAPIFTGSRGEQGAFQTDVPYLWRVAMYNAKFKPYGIPDYSRTNSTEFIFSKYSSINRIKFYDCPIYFNIKYYGPARNLYSTGASNGNILIEAFETPDFSGAPAHIGWETVISSVTNHVYDPHARFYRLKPGTYYLRSYIDSDGDGVRSNWESCGYARIVNDVGDVTCEPIPVVVDEKTSYPHVDILIEDADTDNDSIPDVWEYEMAGTNKVDFLNRMGVSDIVNDGYIYIPQDLVTTGH